MRPDAVQSLRGIQASLMEVIAPELRSAQAQDTLQTMVMLLESLAQGWDTTAHDLVEDNRALERLLDRATSESLLQGLDAELQPLVAAANRSLRLTDLQARNNQLRAGLEKLLIAIEGRTREPGEEGVIALRAEIYSHLRDVAARGWSFWDALSFSESVQRSRRPGA